MKPIVIKETNTRTGEERIHAFERAPVSLGRGKDADVRLDADHVSALHASFLEERGALVFTDHDSSNGSVVDNVQVNGRTVPITESSRIRIGDFSLGVSRVLPPGVKAKKPSASPRDATAGVAAPPTNVLSRSSLDAIRRQGAPAPAPAPVPLRLDDPPPVSAEIAARPTAVPSWRPSSPSVEIDLALAGPVGVQVQTKTLMARDLADLAAAVSLARSRVVEGSMTPKGPPLAATPFPGAPHPWFQEDSEDGEYRDDREPAPPPSRPPPKKTARLIVAAMFGLAFGILGGAALHASLKGHQGESSARSAE